MLIAIPRPFCDIRSLSPAEVLAKNIAWGSGWPRDHCLLRLTEPGSNKGHGLHSLWFLCAPVSCHLSRYVFEIPASRRATNHEVQSSNLSGRAMISKVKYFDSCGIFRDPVIAIIPGVAEHRLRTACRRFAKIRAFSSFRRWPRGVKSRVPLAFSKTVLDLLPVHHSLRRPRPLRLPFVRSLV